MNIDNYHYKDEDSNDGQQLNPLDEFLEEEIKYLCDKLHVTSKELLNKSIEELHNHLLEGTDIQATVKESLRKRNVQKQYNDDLIDRTHIQRKYVQELEKKFLCESLLHIKPDQLSAMGIDDMALRFLISDIYDMTDFKEKYQDFLLKNSKVVIESSDDEKIYWTKPTIRCNAGISDEKRFTGGDAAHREKELEFLCNELEISKEDFLTMSKNDLAKKFLSKDFGSIDDVMKKFKRTLQEYDESKVPKNDCPPNETQMTLKKSNSFKNKTKNIGDTLPRDNELHYDNRTWTTEPPKINESHYSNNNSDISHRKSGGETERLIKCNPESSEIKKKCSSLHNNEGTNKNSKMQKTVIDRIGTDTNQSRKPKTKINLLCKALNLSLEQLKNMSAEQFLKQNVNTDLQHLNKKRLRGGHNEIRAVNFLDYVLKSLFSTLRQSSDSEIESNTCFNKQLQKLKTFSPEDDNNCIQSNGVKGQCSKVRDTGLKIPKRNKKGFQNSELRKEARSVSESEIEPEPEQIESESPCCYIFLPDLILRPENCSEIQLENVKKYVKDNFTVK